MSDLSAGTHMVPRTNLACISKSLCSYRPDGNTNCACMTAKVSSGSIKNLSIGQESVFGTVAHPTSLHIHMPIKRVATRIVKCSCRMTDIPGEAVGVKPRAISVSSCSLHFLCCQMSHHIQRRRLHVQSCCCHAFTHHNFRHKVQWLHAILAQHTL